MLHLVLACFSVLEHAEACVSMLCKILICIEKCDNPSFYQVLYIGAHNFKLFIDLLSTVKDVYFFEILINKSNYVFFWSFTIFFQNFFRIFGFWIFLYGVFFSWGVGPKCSLRQDTDLMTENH